VSWFTDDNLRIKTRVYEDEREGTLGHSLAMAAHELVRLRAFIAGLHRLAVLGEGREHIIAAAHLGENGRIHSLPPPARHGATLRLLPRPEQRSANSGFITNTGRFLEREEAHVVAAAAGQILYRCGGDERRLFSENLW
jgi:hypothetical protein